MHPDRWRKIEETYHAAMQLPRQERTAYLDAACANDRELRLEVESLLDEAAHVEHFMEQPAGRLSLASLDADSQSMEGLFLNHYQIGTLVGSGGMAEVYRARDTRLERDVAVKILHNARFVDRERLQRMYREARLLASLNHPNIGAIYGIEESDGICGLVLELIEGEALSERIGRGPFSIRESLDIARQIAAGLQAAHAKGIIHRDLKPSNVKITPEGTVKIVDFGLAKLLDCLDISDRGTEISTPGLVIGTLAYMSPEQARGRSVDGRTDIWAFGCVLYEMLAGKPAFEGGTPTDVIVKIATEEPDWNRIPKLPEEPVEIERLIRKCMQKSPESRYQSINEIAAEVGVLHRIPYGSPPFSAVPRTPTGEEDFVLPVRSAPALFLMTQAGYMAMYAAAMYHIDSIAKILAGDFQISERTGLIGMLVLAMCGIAVRIYLFTSVGWRHPAAGRKFKLLFPVLLVLDSIWAASPLLLWRRIGYGLALTFVAMLAYVPFAQRTLMRSIYPARAVKIERRR